MTSIKLAPRFQPAPLADAQVALKELAALRLEIDGTSEAAVPLEPLVKRYRMEMSRGDELRLPVPKNSDGQTIRRAIDRLLAAGKEGAGDKEAAMLALLEKFDGAVAQIFRSAAHKED